MQTKIIATVVVASAVITAMSCNWFSSKPVVSKPFDMVGKWQIDTVYQTGKDSTKNWLALAFLDTSYAIKFNVDSTFSLVSKKNSATEKYYVAADTLFIKEDSLFVPHLLTKTNDSVVSITSKDSLVIGLKRQ